MLTRSQPQSNTRTWMPAYRYSYDLADIPTKLKIEPYGYFYDFSHCLTSSSSTACLMDAWTFRMCLANTTSFS
ncbi:hypothetical protein LCGC14_1054100 [marine sediment metagenome]|uniref:Uncharacterized protein n=1 Tax=marine sediment metagenome TaxID=412755 RepID=A0A0F9Q633_9ZZZZ